MQVGARVLVRRVGMVCVGGWGWASGRGARGEGARLWSRPPPLHTSARSAHSVVREVGARTARQVL